MNAQPAEGNVQEVPAANEAAVAEEVQQPIAETGQGGEVHGDVYSGGENAASQGNQQPVISETPQPANEIQVADLTEDVKTEDVNQSENNLEMVAEGGNAPGKSGVVDNNSTNALQNGNNELNLQKENESDNEQNQNDIPVGGQVPQSVPQGEHREGTPLSGGVQETAARLRERIEGTQGDSKSGLREVENRVTREFAQENGLWIDDEFKLGVPFPSGDEHNNYIDAENQVVYKVNNRMHTPSILELLDRMEQHNKLFPNTQYRLVGFTTISKNGDVMPIFAQDFVPDARMATVDEIDSYMGTLGFTRVGDGRYSNGEVVIKDLKPRNVLVNPNGDVFVVDAEFDKTVNEVDEKIKQLNEQERIAKERVQRASLPPKPGHLAVAIGEGNEMAVEEWKAKFDTYLQKLIAEDLPTIDNTIKGMQGRKDDLKKADRSGYKENVNYKAFDYIEKALKKRKKELENTQKPLKKVVPTTLQEVAEAVREKAQEKAEKQQGSLELDRENSAFERATENVMKKLEATGVKVKVLTKEEAERELAELEELADMQKRKSPETALPEDESSFKGTVISSDNGTKILNDLDSAIKEYENDTTTKEKTFLGRLAGVLGARKHGSNSQYATFEAMNGKVFTIRLANHNAKVSTFDNHNEDEGISIVVTAQENNGITNDGNAHLVEFFYDAIKLRKADGKPLVEILKSIKQALYSGEYKDNTGLAQAEEVNIPEFLRTSDGTTYGWAVNGTIYLTPEGINPNTPVHEYTHLWAAAIEQSDAKLWGEVVEAMKLSPMWNEVMTDENYSDIHDDDNRVASEVLSRLSGNEGYKRAMAEAERGINSEKNPIEKIRKIGVVGQIKQAVVRFWNKIKALFGGSKDESWEKFVNMTLADFDKGVNPDVKESPLDRMFIGEKGATNLDKAEEATTRLDNLAVAREMETAGKDAKSVKLATGWERGADGKWRYETEDIKVDRGAQLFSLETYKSFPIADAIEIGRVDDNCTIRLSDLVNDSELFKAYPEMGEYYVSFEKMDAETKGRHNFEDKMIRINKDDISSLGSTLAHEIQHAIQSIEGFAKGGNMNTADWLNGKSKVWSWKRALDRLAKERPDIAGTMELEKALVEEYKAEGLESYIPSEAQRVKAFNLYSRGYDNEGYEAAYNESIKAAGKSVYKIYNDLAGEVESRNVQERMGMTEEQRRNSLAKETEDVAREDQIFIYDNLGVSAMGTNVDNRMAEIANRLKGKELTEEQQKVVDVYSGKADNLIISVKTKDGNTRNIEIRQGSEDGAGTKHSLYAHYGTSKGVITADDIILIPDVIAKGDRIENGKKAVYKLNVNGTKYTVVTYVKQNKEEFHNFYSNKKGQSSQSVNALIGDTQNARITEELASEGKGSNNSANTQEEAVLFREGGKQKALKENAKAIRKLHNVSSRFSITALRNLGFALETKEQREEHARLFAERDAITGVAGKAIEVNVNPQGLTVLESVTESLMKLANENNENVETRLAAIRAKVLNKNKNSSAYRQPCLFT